MKKLLACTAALLLLLGTQTTLADHRDGWDRDRHDRHDRHDNGRGWGRHDNRWNRHDRHDSRDEVRISLNFGSVFPDYRYRDYNRAISGYGVPYTTTWGPPGRRYDNRTVIVHQNTYINSAPRTRTVTRPGRNSTSLFRDITGRCYEREIDGRGVETRTELPGEACNF